MHPQSASRDLLRNVFLGVTLGAVLAGICLFVGLIRIALFLLRGGHLMAISWADVQPLAFYVGGFIFGGAFVGLASRFVWGRAGVYGAVMAGGAITMSLIAVGDRGLAAMSSGSWIAASLLGAMFGFALTRGFLGRF